MDNIKPEEMMKLLKSGKIKHIDVYFEKEGKPNIFNRFEDWFDVKIGWFLMKPEKYRSYMLSKKK